MPWVKVDDGLCEHPKVFRAGTSLGRHGTARVLAVWLEAACYVARNLTDGRLSRQVVATMRHDPKPLDVAAALVESGLWEADGVDYRVHDWLAYQPDARTVQSWRAKGRERTRRWRRAHAACDGDGDGVTGGEGDARRDPRGDGVTEGAGDASGDGPGDGGRDGSRDGGRDGVGDGGGNGPGDAPVTRPRARSPIPIPKNVPTRAREDDPTRPTETEAERAGAFVRWYEAHYRRERAAHYLRRPALDYDHACRLVRTYADDGWLQKLAEYYLVCDHPDARRVSRTIGQFAHLSGWIDQQLRAHGHRPATEAVTT